MFINIFPDGGGSHRVRPEKKDYWKVAISLFLITLLVVLYALEIPNFSRVIAIESLLVRSMIVGLIFGGFLGFFFTKTVKDYLDRLKIYLLMLFIGALVMPILFTLSNRLLSPYSSTVEQVELVKFEPFAQFGITQSDLIKGVEPSGYYLFFIRKGIIERTSIKTPLFTTTKRGEQISLPIYKGLWGYEVIDIK